MEFYHYDCWCKRATATKNIATKIGEPRIGLTLSRTSVVDPTGFPMDGRDQIENWW